jgi:DNA-binding NtrC family response regulator
MDPTLLSSSRPEVRGATITVTSGDADAPPLVIGAEKAVIGRNAGCALVLADKKVSRAQLEVVGTPHGVLVRDLGSSNGTYLGDLRVVEVLLTKPATLRCGDTFLELRPGKAERVPVAKADRFGPLTGATPHMRAMFEKLRVLAPTTLPVLIEGETGTGKELVAQAIHEASKRAKGPFVVVDCGAIAPTLAESTLFGHERGSFTGAASRRVSPFVEASGGTLFLDELGELPLDVQPKLLRVLADQRVKSLGSNTYAPVDVRVVAATRRNLLEDINDGKFRDDLYFRIAHERIDVPPLRARADDIPLLVKRMFEDEGHGPSFRRVTAESLNRLVRHDWPGNVRELKPLVTRALAYDEGGPIDLGKYLHQPPAPPRKRTEERWRARSYEESKEEHDRGFFAGLYAAARGNLSEMSRRAGLTRGTVRTYLRELKIGDARGE